MKAAERSKLEAPRAFFALSFMASLVPALIHLLRDGRAWIPAVGVIGGIGIVGWLIMQRGERHSVNLFLSLAMLNLMIVVPELALRLTGFRYAAGIQFGHEQHAHFDRYVPDAELFWRLPAGQSGGNRLGFPGHDPVTPKPANLYRIVFLGDSCTMQGYPYKLHAVLNETYSTSDRAFDCVNMALAGYTSYQGRRVADLYGDVLQPDLVTVYFGWNDHWLAYGAIDRDKKIKVAMRRVLGGSRFLQFLNKTLAGAGLLRAEPLDVYRVSIVDYQANLRYIQSFFAERDVPVVFLTAPTSHYRLGVPPMLVEVKPGQQATTIEHAHRIYNDVVRRVAEQTSSALIDLERIFDAEDPIDPFFTDDGIHLTDQGLRRIAEQIEGHLVGRLGLERESR